MFIAMSSGPRFFLACAFIIAGVHPRPGQEIHLGGKRSIFTPISVRITGGAVCDRRYGLQKFEFLFEVDFNLFLDLKLHGFYGSIHVIAVVHAFMGEDNTVKVFGHKRVLGHKAFL
jgi:hypothetical protein